MELEDGFNFEKLTKMTEGSAGSDLSEICRRVVLEASLRPYDEPISLQAFERTINSYSCQKSTDHQSFPDLD